MDDGPDADTAVRRPRERVEARRPRDGKAPTPEDAAGAEHLRMRSRHGIIDIMRGGLPPPDHDTVAERAQQTQSDGRNVRTAALARLVASKGPAP